MEFFETVVTIDAKQRVQSCLDSGYLSEGKLVKEFEQELESMFGYRNSVALNSCTSALHLALILAGVRAGDEVILPAQTFVATGLAILYCRATPVFADIGMDGNIDVDSVSSKITDRTKAVISVAWGGNPCDLDRMAFVLGATNIRFIQDNAQALGATYDGKPVTDWADFSCFSFQAIKHVTSGDGGLLVCDSPLSRDSARRRRWFNVDREYDVVDETGERQYNLKEVGYKYHMSDYNAALGLGNLHGFWERQKRRKQIADYYSSELSDWVVDKNVGSSHWLCDLLVDSRGDFIRMMTDKGIPVSVVHKGIDRNDIFGGVQDLVMQRYWDKHHICIPLHSSLTDDDVDKVVSAVKGGW